MKCSDIKYCREGQNLSRDKVEDEYLWPNVKDQSVEEIEMSTNCATEIFNPISASIEAEMKDQGQFFLSE